MAKVDSRSTVEIVERGPDVPSLDGFAPVVAPEHPVAVAETAVDTRGVRIELGEPLKGHYLRIDAEQITSGFIEDLQSGLMAPTLDGLAELTLSGDLFEPGHQREWLRGLKVREFGAVANALVLAMKTLPKVS